MQQSPIYLLKVVVITKILMSTLTVKVMLGLVQVKNYYKQVVLVTKFETICYWFRDVFATNDNIIIGFGLYWYKRSWELLQNMREVCDRQKQFVTSTPLIQALSKLTLVVIITDLNICCYQPALQSFIQFKVALSMWEKSRLKTATNKLYWSLSLKQVVVGSVMCL
eukprot:TRINITY_DN1830_c1_g1_i6.p2 TRINITY_DN1830_c1_g1~~TRINITY_DN1830_c1_g1_i6.p2  ORF type:complete len:166 (-),score=2.41 TRINITY_DN1830_c1_g1_i6:153-650(-)